VSYILIPDEVAQDHEISDKAKLLYGYALRLHQMKGLGCNARNEYFCDKLRVHERQIQRYLSQLKDRKHILIYIKRHTSGKIANRKIIPKHIHIKKEVKDGV